MCKHAICAKMINIHILSKLYTIMLTCSNIELNVEPQSLAYWNIQEPTTNLNKLSYIAKLFDLKKCIYIQNWNDEQCNIFFPPTILHGSSWSHQEVMAWLNGNQTNNPTQWTEMHQYINIVDIRSLQNPFKTAGPYTTANSLLVYTSRGQRAARVFEALFTSIHRLLKWVVLARCSCSKMFALGLLVASLGSMVHWCFGNSFALLSWSIVFNNDIYVL